MENLGQMVWNKIIVFVLLSILPMIVGGWVAYRKKDYIARGVVVSLFSSWFGPLFMYFEAESKARQGDDEDEGSWPSTGPMASLCFIVSILLYYFGKSLWD